jgi:nitrate reductase NapE component
MSLYRKHLFCFCTITSFLFISMGIWSSGGVDLNIKYLLQAAEIGLYGFIVPQGPWHRH